MTEGSIALGSIAACTPVLRALLIVARIFGKIATNERAAGRSQLECDSRRVQIDRYDVNVEVARRRFRARDMRNAPKRLLDVLGCGKCGGEAPERAQRECGANLPKWTAAAGESPGIHPFTVLLSGANGRRSGSGSEHFPIKIRDVQYGGERLQVTQLFQRRVPVAPDVLHIAARDHPEQFFGSMSDLRRLAVVHPDSL